jgi:hypothetical protein
MHPRSHREVERAARRRRLLATCALAPLVLASPSVQAQGVFKSRATTDTPTEEKEAQPEPSTKGTVRPVAPTKTPIGTAVQPSPQPAPSSGKDPQLGPADEKQKMKKMAPQPVPLSGLLPGPSMDCPCSADLDNHDWNGGSIPTGGCIKNAGNGFPQYGFAREVFDGPEVTTFTILTGDKEPDGVRDYTCRVIYDEDGIGGNPPSSTSHHPIPEAALFACAARLSSNPQKVLDCILP